MSIKKKNHEWLYHIVTIKFFHRLKILMALHSFVLNFHLTFLKQFSDQTTLWISNHHSRVKKNHSISILKSRNQTNEKKSLSRFANYRAGKINRYRPETETTASHRRRNFFNNHSVRSARMVAVLERLIS